MPRVPFVLVDVFADRALEGNQLCVLLDSPDLDVELVQALAMEIGFSETTWVLETAPDRYRMRIFTPAKELPFAGHPSLGTAFVLAALGKTGRSVVQHVEAGEYAISVDLDGGRARMAQGAVEFGTPYEDRAALAAALDLSPGALDPDLFPQPASAGVAHLMVPLVSIESVRAARPDDLALLKISETTGCECVYIFASETEGRAEARLFGPAVGIAEDPATGSAAGPLGAFLYANDRLQRDLEVDQGHQVGRPSRLVVEVEGPKDAPFAWVSGGVRIIGQGAFDVPDP